MKKWLGILKVLHEVTDYPMSIISKIAQQRLNDSQSKNNETNETSNKIQLILTYSGKQGKKLKKKMKKYIRKTLTENVQVIWHIKVKSCLQSLMLKIKQNFIVKVIYFTLENDLIKHVQRTILEKLIAGLRKE